MNDHRHVYTKSRLIKELAFRAGIKKIASRQILEVLAEIIKRETPNGPFILPGLCKFELVPRKALRMALLSMPVSARQSFTIVVRGHWITRSGSIPNSPR